MFWLNRLIFVIVSAEFWRMWDSCSAATKISQSKVGETRARKCRRLTHMNWTAARIHTHKLPSRPNDWGRARKAAGDEQARNNSNRRVWALPTRRSLGSTGTFHVLFLFCADGGWNFARVFQLSGWTFTRLNCGQCGSTKLLFIRFYKALSVDNELFFCATPLIHKR